MWCWWGESRPFREYKAVVWWFIEAQSFSASTVFIDVCCLMFHFLMSVWLKEIKNCDSQHLSLSRNPQSHTSSLCAIELHPYSDLVLWHQNPLFTTISMNSHILFYLDWTASCRHIHSLDHQQSPLVLQYELFWPAVWQNDSLRNTSNKQIAVFDSGSEAIHLCISWKCSLYKLFILV